MQNPKFLGLFIRSQAIKPLVFTITVADGVLAVLRQPLFALLDVNVELTLPITVRIGESLRVSIGHLPQWQCPYRIVHGSKEFNRIQVEHCQAA